MVSKMLTGAAFGATAALVFADPALVLLATVGAVAAQEIAARVMLRRRG